MRLLVQVKQTECRCACAHESRNEKPGSDPAKKYPGNEAAQTVSNLAMRFNKRNAEQPVRGTCITGTSRWRWAGRRGSRRHNLRDG